MGPKKRIAIIGAGAAGLVAAVAALRTGAVVSVYEKHSRPGRKILATGNGRCNISNTDLGLSHFHGQTPGFAAYALEQFGFAACREFFEGLGLAYRIADNGRAYPYSHQASSVVELLLYELEALGGRLITEASVTAVRFENGAFFLDGTGESGSFDRVLVATGGKAAPGLCGDGEGYGLLAPFGHRVVEPFPSLVQLKLDASFLKRISGVKIEGAITLLSGDDTVLQKAAGDLLFTDYGISGNAVLDISRKAGERLQRGETLYVRLDAFPEHETAELDALLLARFTLQPKKEAAASLVGLVNKKLAPAVVAAAGIAAERNVANLSKKERKALVRVLKGWEFSVTGTQEWSRAEVTAGGINTENVNPKTMESALQKGLYLAGELLDIDGDCGGYNLHWAWASGYLAGKSMAE
jgi:hypothetical protein